MMRDYITAKERTTFENKFLKKYRLPALAILFSFLVIFFFV